MAWQPDRPKFTTLIAENVAWNWNCQLEVGEIEPTELGQPKYRSDRNNSGSPHQHNVWCLWIWHDCAQVLGEKTVAPGETYGWRPTGIGLHTLVNADPEHLTVVASLVWPECCGLHGYITDGHWIPV